MMCVQAHRKTGFLRGTEARVCVGGNSRSWFILAPELQLVCASGDCVAAGC